MGKPPQTSRIRASGERHTGERYMAKPIISQSASQTDSSHDDRIKRFNSILEKTGRPDLIKNALLQAVRTVMEYEGPSQIEEFLRSVWPDVPGGFYCLGTRPPGGKMRLHWFKSVGEAIAEAEKLKDAEKDVYYAVPAFSSQSKTQAAAISCKVFLLDADVGEGKAYSSQFEAFEAICAFADRLGVHPVIVNSGNGLQALFLMDSPIPKEEWDKTASNLASAYKTGGIKDDPSRTQDISSLMRLPDTLNHRNPANPKKTGVSRYGEPISLQEFQKGLSRVTQFAPEAAAPLSEIPASPRVQKADANDDFLPPSDPETPENIERVKSALATVSPDIVYGDWMNILRALKSTDWVCAKELAREWSAKGSKWEEGAFEDKWENQIDRNGGISIGTLYHHAKENGWNDAAVAQSGRADAGESESGEASGDGKKKKKSPSIEFLFVQYATGGRTLAREKRALFEWVGTHWQHRLKEEWEGWANRFLKRKFPSDYTASKMRSCVDMLESDLDIEPLRETPPGFEAVIPTRSAYIHIMKDGSKVEKAPDPALGIKHCLAIDYDPQARAPLFEKFICEAIPDGEVRKTLQEYAGYTLIKSAKFEKALILTGSGANGKSTFIDAIVSIHANAQSFDPGQMEGSRLQKTISASLLVCPELNEKKFQEEKFKAVVSGDMMDVDIKHKEAESPRLCGKVIIGLNTMPHFSDTTKALWRRLLIVPFNVSFEGREDLGLKEHITQAEKAGVLNWAVEGLERLLKNGRFTVAEDIRLKIEEEKTNSDPIRQWVIENNVRLETDIKKMAQKEAVYRNYSEWAKAQGYFPKASNSFWRTLKGIPSLAGLNADLKLDHVAGRPRGASVTLATP